MELTKIEKEILIFINNETWNKDHPKKVKLQKRGNFGRAKIRWHNIRWDKKKHKLFTNNNKEFDKALNTLKSKKLITSRTKCKLYAGLTCTRKGHNYTIQNLIIAY